MVEKNIGLGRGLDSLIPKIDENDETSYTLEEILNNSKGENKEEEEIEEKTEDIEDNTEKNDTSTSSKKTASKKKTAKKAKKSTSTKTTKKTSKPKNENKKSEENKKTDKIATDENIETPSSQDQDNDLKSTNDSKKIESDVSQDLSVDPIVESNVNDVKKVIGKNPRITLWSVKSAAVLRYLRKTKPEFSISKEASELIDEAISNKYPEIWELFEDLENEK
ncbi:MAG: hypothetical protein LBU40_00745 [Methanobrevibacter sp.]|jgi:hypothetical protein|nr:hypothetical protein [Methanobrevibacter sp.]